MIKISNGCWSWFFCSHTGVKTWHRLWFMDSPPIPSGLFTKRNRKFYRRPKSIGPIFFCTNWPAFSFLQLHFIQRFAAAIFLARRGRSRMHQMLASLHARIPIMGCTHASIHCWLSSKVQNKSSLDSSFEYIFTFWCQLSTYISLDFFKFENNFDFLVPAFTQIHQIS